ncbi:hypothetical protein ACN47E_004861 [Coniothyrium glycines]
MDADAVSEDSNPSRKKMPEFDPKDPVLPEKRDPMSDGKSRTVGYTIDGNDSNHDLGLGVTQDTCHQSPIGTDSIAPHAAASILEGVETRIDMREASVVGTSDNKSVPPSPEAKAMALDKSPSPNQSGRLDTAPAPQPSPNFPTLFGLVTSFLGNFFQSEPAIVEYSNDEINRRTDLWVVASRARRSRSVSGQDPVLVKILVVEKPGNHSRGAMRSIEIVAKHKRVNEIKMSDGVSYVAEEVYRDQIRAALRRVKAPQI